MAKMVLPKICPGTESGCGIFCPGPNLAAVFGPLGQDLAARFRPRTECGSQILSYSIYIP